MARTVFYDRCHRCDDEFEVWEPGTQEIPAEKMASKNSAVVRVLVDYGQEDQLIGCGKLYDRKTPICRKCLGKILKWWGETMLEEAGE